MKYSSDVVLEFVVTVWKIYIAIYNGGQLVEMFVNSPSREIIVEFSINLVFDHGDCH